MIISNYSRIKLFIPWVRCEVIRGQFSHCFSQHGPMLLVMTISHGFITFKQQKNNEKLMLRVLEDFTVKVKI